MQSMKTLTGSRRSKAWAMVEGPAWVACDWSRPNPWIMGSVAVTYSAFLYLAKLQGGAMAMANARTTILTSHSTSLRKGIIVLLPN